MNADSRMGSPAFEFNAAEGHHDHLICIRCGRIIEFENEQIEALQRGVAKKNKFQVHSINWNFTDIA